MHMRVRESHVAGALRQSAGEPDTWSWAAGMVTVMDGPYTGPFNIGNPTEFTMLELAKVVQEVVNPAAEIVFRENTADDPSRRKPDIGKARRPHVERWACTHDDGRTRASQTLAGHGTQAHLCVERLTLSAHVKEAGAEAWCTR